MLPHTFHASKYQSQTAQFRNPPAMIIALCEKAISCIYAAQEALKNDQNHNWRTNLGTVHDILQLIATTLHHSKQSKEIEEMKKFYDSLALYTTGLIVNKLDSSKSQDLLESIQITRDMWKKIEQQYVELQSSNAPPANNSFNGML